jgi:ABC-type amino acid transport substrate-binding protein
MCSACKLVALAVVVQAFGPAIASADRKVRTTSDGVLRVCADPNNLPFSNDRGEGFENKIAALVARDLRRSLQYYWLPQRRGFIRNTLRANRCDLVTGIPAASELVRATAPYYRSTYVFVTRLDRRLDVRSLGYFANREQASLDVTPVMPRIDGPFVRFVFDIAMGVRRDDRELGDAVDRILARRRAEIRRILTSYGVPLVDEH